VSDFHAHITWTREVFLFHDKGRFQAQLEYWQASSLTGWCYRHRGGRPEPGTYKSNGKWNLDSTGKDLELLSRWVAFWS
jgi:hypothetical protein